MDGSAHAGHASVLPPQRGAPWQLRAETDLHPSAVPWSREMTAVRSEAAEGVETVELGIDNDELGTDKSKHTSANESVKEATSSPATPPSSKR